MFKTKQWMIVLFTLVMMVGTYLLIDDLTGLATPFALVVLFIDETIILFLGIIGWRVDQLINRFKK